MKRQRIAMVTAAGAMCAGLLGVPAAHAAGPEHAQSGADRAGAQADSALHTAAIRHTKGAHDDHGTLVMVHPTGGFTTLGEVSDDASIRGISTDGKEVMTARSQDGQTRVTVWDVKTHRPHYFRIDGEHARLAFAGHRVIVSTPHETSLRSRTGTMLRNYDQMNRSVHGTLLASADGSHFMFSTKKGVTAVNTKTGVTTNTVKAPKDQINCAPTNRWDRKSAVMVCEWKHGVGGDRPYRIGYTSGVQATPLTKAGSGAVWRTSPVRVVQRGSAACPEPAGFFEDGTWQDIELPGKGTPQVAGASGTMVDLLRVSCGSGYGVKLQRYDLKTKKVTNLAGTKATGGGVITDARSVASH